MNYAVMYEHDRTSGQSKAPLNLIVNERGIYIYKEFSPQSVTHAIRATF